MESFFAVYCFMRYSHSTPYQSDTDSDIIIKTVSKGILEKCEYTSSANVLTMTRIIFYSFVSSFFLWFLFGPFHGLTNVWSKGWLRYFVLFEEDYFIFLRFFSMHIIDK